jgi:hypothetical protein
MNSYWHHCQFLAGSRSSRISENVQSGKITGYKVRVKATLRLTVGQSVRSVSFGVESQGAHDQIFITSDVALLPKAGKQLYIHIKFF